MEKKTYKKPSVLNMTLIPMEDVFQNGTHLDADPNTNVGENDGGFAKGGLFDMGEEISQSDEEETLF